MSKYKAKRTTRTLPDGSVLKFDSLAEAAWFDKTTLEHPDWQVVRIHQGAPLVTLAIEGGHYTPDFCIVEANAKTYVIEIKGGHWGKTERGRQKLVSSATADWKRKMRQLRERYPDLRLKIIYGHTDKSRIFITTKEEWLHDPDS